MATVSNVLTNTLSAPDRDGLSNRVILMIFDG